MEKSKTKKAGKVKQRRARTDSTKRAVEVAAAATRSIKPPARVRMTERDLEFFDSVVAEFAKVEWTTHRIELAALLAQAMCDLEEEKFQLRKEGSMLVLKTNKKANEYKVINPRQGTVKMAANLVLSLRRSLSLHARAREGEARDVAARRLSERQIEESVLLNDDEDDFFAKPASTH